MRDENVRNFYDRTAYLWKNIWGEHMHHGYYQKGGRRINRKAAQERLILELLKFGEPGNPGRILDAGCGIGGSACWLAHEFNAYVLGLTLGHQQATLATQVIGDHEVQDKVVVREQDVMKLESSDGPFDLVWCVECLEHVTDKSRLFALFNNLLNAGGQILLTTWCLENEDMRESPEYSQLLGKVYRAFHWAPLSTINELNAMLCDSGIAHVEHRDWTSYVKPYWTDIRKSALQPANVKLIHRFSWSAVKGVLSLSHLERAVEAGLIRYVAFSCRKGGSIGSRQSAVGNWQ